MPCIEIALTLYYPTPNPSDVSAVWEAEDIGLTSLPNGYQSWTWRVGLGNCAGSEYAYHNAGKGITESVVSLIPGFSLTPLEALTEEVIAVPFTTPGYWDGSVSGPIISQGCVPTNVRAFTTRRYQLCVPDWFCASGGRLCIIGVARSNYVYRCGTNPANGQPYVIHTRLLNSGFRLCTTPAGPNPTCEDLRSTGRLCTGGGSTGDCTQTPCGECCEQDRLMRAARLWHPDGNVYSVAQGTFARNAPGSASTYPCGCGNVSQPQPAGDFFATDIHDRNNPSRLAGSQSVSLWHVGGVLEGASLETVGTAKVARLFRTRDFGREFSVVDIPGTYDFIRVVPHNGRILLFGFRKKAAGSPPDTKQLFVRVGKQLADATYSWSGEKVVALPAGAPEPRCGDFDPVVRPDGVVELYYLSASPPCGSRVYRSHRIDLDATNEWVG